MAFLLPCSVVFAYNKTDTELILFKYYFGKNENNFFSDRITG